jgi:hypothetical protein
MSLRICPLFEGIFYIKMEKNIEPQFLDDKALTNTTSDELGHKSIAQTLHEIIKICPLPFTIGLFGNWGTGKSTIANFLVDRIEKFNEKGKNNKIAVVEFDVWKYEKDSLRRQFVLNLENKLKGKFLDEEYKIDPRVEHSTSREFEGKLTLSKKNLSQTTFIFVGIALITLFGLIGFGISKLATDFLPIYMATILTPIFSGVTIFFIFQVVSKVITTEKETWTSDKFKDPDEFEKVFEDIINKSTAQRILIIFDNLDRATDKKAVELLSTIKTFLEPKTEKCVFLIQCDEEAIRKHLVKLYNYGEGSKEKDTDEFLRKFFNTFIKIPPFIEADLGEYTKRLLKHTEVESLYKNSDLVTIIVKAFRENPRQIKQFVNTFLAHYMLAIQRESGRKPIISKGAITSDPAPLAKLLVIRQKWPSEYKEIIEDPKILSLPMEGEIGGFMEATNTVPITDARTLIYLKKSSNELALGNFGANLKIALEDSKGEEATKLINEALDQKVKDDEINNFVVELLDLNGDQNQNLINIINLVGGINISIKENLAEKVAEIIYKKLREQLALLKVTSVINLIKVTRKGYSHRKGVIGAYIQLLADGKDVEISESFIKIILGNVDMFIGSKKEISEALEKGHSENTKVLELFQGMRKAIQAFISDDLLAKFIESIPVPSADKPEIFSEVILDKRANLVLSLDLNTSAEVGGPFLRKMDELILAYLSSPQPEREKYFLEALRYAELGIDRYSQKVEQDVLNHLGDSLQQAINTFGEYPRKAKLIAPITKLASFVSEDKKTGLQQTLQAFFQGADIEMLKTSLEPDDEDMRKRLFTLVKETLENRAVSDPNVFDVIWSYEDVVGRSNLLIKIIDTANYQTALNKLDTLRYRVTNKIGIAKRIFDKASSLEVGQRAVPYEAINGLKCGGDKELKGLYVDQLQSLIVNQPRQTQEIAFDAYNEAVSLGFLSNSLRLKFAESIIEWLNTLGTIGLEQEFALNAVVLDSNELSITHKDNLLNCLFDKMIARTGAIEEINLGFELLYQLKPDLRYDKNNKQHFDVVYSRVEVEQNVDIKKSIITGFEKIKPKTISKFSKSFWNGVRKISKSLLV